MANQVEAIQNVADALEEVANEMYSKRDEKCDFNGYSVADSLGVIADALFQISQTYAEDCKRKWDNQ
jgi:hypothetical protein